ncbi:MAG: AcrB/AcrD/AcrF family protein [Caldithrix sp.]|nr:AcrB/AcrD/AcrF family protein [Caldithrix sp.]
MKNVINFFVKYKVWTNVLLFGIFGFGLISLALMRYSFFPEIRPDNLTVQVVYPGASPEEVEEGVVLKVEENIDGIENIERITSVSRENIGTVNVEVTKGADLDKVLTDVKNAVDRINSFPQGIEKPVIFEQQFRSRALSVVLYGNTDLYNLKYIAERMRDDLINTPAISQVTIDGLPNLEFSIEVSESDLRRYNIRFDEIVRAVGSANINISGGKFETPDEEILIRAYGRDYQAKKLGDIAIRGSRGGEIIYLKDIATVKEKWEDTPEATYYNDRPALVLLIDKTKQEDILKVAETTYQMVDNFNAANEQIKAEILDDRTISLQQRLELLVRNGLIGLLLVITTLGFFLNLRLSFWVSIGIPFSFAGMMIIANLVGITINVISLFGMIIVVGILVDDAIVVAENIFAHYERGAAPMKAAIEGTQEVVAPVFTSVMTTIIAFTPFFFLDGTFGKFIWHMALVVIATLAFSLIEAFLILPAHMAHSKGLHPHQQDSPLRKKIEQFINFLTHRLYSPSLTLALKHKWITVVLPVFFVMLTIGLIGGGFIGVTFFPFIDGDTLPVNVSLVAGRQEADTDSLLKRIERAAWRINAQIKQEREDNREVITGIKREIGSNDFGESGSNTGRLTLQLLDAEKRQMDSFVIANRLRAEVGPLPMVQNITFGRTGFFGKPVSISLLGYDLAELNKARDVLLNALQSYETLKDVTDSNQEGRREINITLKPRAAALGLTLRDIAGQVRQGFFGQEVQRIQRGRDEIKVWVRYDPQDRRALGQLDQMQIRSQNGEAYPFSELAQYELQRGLTAINHLNRYREIKVEANLSDVDLELPPILNKIRREIVPQIKANTDNIQVLFEGQSRNQQKFQQSMQRSFSIALLLMFIFVTLVFRSYMQAFMIFSLIPIGILGAIWGHGIQGIKLNILSIYGVIALSGIIINDSIVFVDQINRNLRSGQKIFDAVHNAGLARLRPILLTTLTTVFGLGPIILETSRQAQFLIPMAVSVAYGLLFGTFILLIILPALFLAINSVRYNLNTVISKDHKTRENVEPSLKEIVTIEKLNNQETK